MDEQNNGMNTTPEEKDPSMPSATSEKEPEMTTPVTETPEPAGDAPVAPQPAPQQPSAPQPVYHQPVAPQPPVNGWSGSSYRYVPGQANQSGVPGSVDQPYAAPRSPQYTSPAGNGYYTPGVQSPVPPPVQPPKPPVAPPVTPSAQPPKPPRKKNSGWIVAIAIIAAIGVIAAIVCLGIGVMYLDEGNSTSSSYGSSVVLPENSDVPSLEITPWDDDDGGLSTREVVNRNLDSTVVLTVYTQSREFQFGESTLQEAGAASGIIMSEDGYIITNWHCVIQEETNTPFDYIEVTLHDGTEYEAEVIGADSTTDLAVIKVDASGLSVAQFGDSSSLQMGDRVIALGNAAGLSWTATQGIVSALARDVYDDTGYALKCLQTDAAINPGNSGGPLLNNQGLVVGINSSKIAASGYEGLGFSIPINEAKVIVESLMRYGFVKGRVALGITGRTVSSGMYNGFMIATISDGSSLKNTEARVGDLIVAVDGQSVKDYGELRSALAKHSVGDRVTLELLRSDERSGRVSSITISVVLQEQTAD